MQKRKLANPSNNTICCRSRKRHFRFHRFQKIPTTNKKNINFKIISHYYWMYPHDLLRTTFLAFFPSYTFANVGECLFSKCRNTMHTKIIERMSHGILKSTISWAPKSIEPKKIKHESLGSIPDRTSVPAGK